MFARVVLCALTLALFARAENLTMAGNSAIASAHTAGALRVVDTAAPTGPWLGIRATPIPEALHAHLRADGVMITNIVIDGPADAAGLDRFDVITRVGDAPIRSMSDLRDALANAPIGEALPFTAIHQGDLRQCSVKLRKRPTDDAVAFRFEEPDAWETRDDLSITGKFVHQGPDGRLIITPLGPMNKLPPDLQRMIAPHLDEWDHETGDLDDAFRAWIGDSTELPDMPWRQFRVQLDEDEPGFIFIEPDATTLNAPAGDDVSIEMSVVEDGASLRISRGSDGVFVVERRDAEGNVANTSYDSLVELRDADPDAYQRYAELRGVGGFRFNIAVPSADRLRAAQQDFERKLNQAREQSKTITRQSRQQWNRLRQRHDALLQRNVDELSVGRIPSARVAPETSAHSLLLEVDEDGRITLSITRDGQTEVHNFRNRTDFRKREPDLFRRYRGLLSAD